MSGRERHAPQEDRAMQGITDEQIERVKAALASATDNINEGRTESSLPHPELILWPSEYEYLAEVAIAAALGDVEPEPLEDVIGDDLYVDIAIVQKPGVCVASVTTFDHIDIIPRSGHGTGPTIDAAIRAAVANATEERP